MSYLVSDLIQETRRSLLGMHPVQLNQLAAPMGTTDLLLTLTYPLASVVRGHYISIDDELMYVWGVNPSNSQVTVQRGMLGTTPVNHLVNAIVEDQPRYPNYMIRYAMREEIRSWGPQVYAVSSMTFQTVNDQRGYDLQQLVNDNFYDILSVRHSTPNTLGSPNVESWPKVKHWSIFRNAPTTDFASGTGLILPFPFIQNQVYDSTGGYTVTYQTSLPVISVVYSKPFNVDVNNFSDSTDVIATVGLDETMVDIPPIGTAWRLMSQRENLRTQSEAQGQPTDLQFVPPLYSLKAAQGLKELRDSRLGDAQVWLISRYGIENWGI